MAIAIAFFSVSLAVLMVVIFMQNKTICEKNEAIEAWRDTCHRKEDEINRRSDRHREAINEYKLQLATQAGEIFRLERLEIDDATEQMQNFDDEREKEAFMRAYLGGDRC